MSCWDITRPLAEDALLFPGDPPISFAEEKKERYRITQLAISTHSGTHIDAPSHFIPGAATIDEVPLANLIGHCRVVDLGEADGPIEPDRLAGRIDGTKRVLFKTVFSGESAFREDYPHLTLASARLLADAGMVCVGIDSPSIEAYEGDGSVHRMLLSQGTAIVELLDLSAVHAGEYCLTALPLRLARLDGAPARVLICERDSPALGERPVGEEL
jgi:arylformamidase